MWLSERKKNADSEQNCMTIGLVTIGGAKPSVLVEGEIRNVELVSSGVMRVPKAGDEVLVLRTSEGDGVAVGFIGAVSPDGIENGEIKISTGTGGFIKLKNNGDIELCGTVSIKGTTKIEGELLVNGAAVPSIS